MRSIYTLLFCCWAAVLTAGADEWRFFVPETMSGPAHRLEKNAFTLIFPNERGTGYLEKDFTGLKGDAVKITVKSDADPAMNNRVGVIVHLMKNEKDRISTFYLDPVIGKDGKLEFAGTFDREGAERCRVSLFGRWFAGQVTFRDVQVQDAPAVPVRKARIITTRLWPSSPATCEKNRQMMQDMLDRIVECDEKPDLVLFSEGIADCQVRAPLKERAEPVNGPTFQMLSAWSKKNRCYTVVSIHEVDNGSYYNTGIIVGRNGELVGRYRKNHLTWGETRKGLLPGNDFPVFDLDFGKVGIQICWDNWFPESARALRLNGAEIILLPIAGDGLVLHRDHVWAARALENSVYLVTSATYPSREDGAAPCRIYAPDGRILAQTAERGRFARADITLPFRNPVIYLSVGASKGEPRNLYVRERNVEAGKRLNGF